MTQGQRGLGFQVGRPRLHSKTTRGREPESRVGDITINIDAENSANVQTKWIGLRNFQAKTAGTHGNDHRS